MGEITIRVFLAGLFLFSGLYPTVGSAQHPIELRLQAGSGPSLTLPDALESAANSFFGPTPVGGGFNLSADDIFGETDGARQSSGASYALSLQASQLIWSRPDMDIMWDAMLSVGQAYYRLPEGAGPLIDPISVRFDYVTLTPRLYSQIERPVGGSGVWGVRSGGGVEVSRTRVAITSALLDVRDTSIHATGFVFTDAYYGWDSSYNGQIAFGVQVTQDKTFALNLGVSAAY
ncbi:hypothetical protein L0666_00150 [Octadecabacter sp. CECT 8868]|uniref:hypothetical protein n=1 Tax=Octadecabacter algicola TaxID=2909342 RepID=UPI001F16E19F|nr:hypothetical protein [Octadecabacter algicola]MCF2903384.1 hypothetical protein [Octadecabacter algicola]